jgi:Flp pilus assembly protein TadG
MIRHLQTALSRSVNRAALFPVVRRFLRREDGATAVEFAMIATPFLAAVFAIIETAFVFFASQTLETAAADSARLIMTGQAQSQSFDQGKFKAAVCARIYGLFDCTGGLLIDVKAYTAFSNINNNQLPLDANGNLQSSGFGYQPGGPGDIVVVRLMYQWPTYVPQLGNNLSNMSGNKRLLMATVSFRNEPYAVGN